MVVNLVGVGVSKETDPDLAIAEVINSAVIQANLPEVNWILIFFTQEHFVHAMAFPHKVDSFPNLAKVIDLPAETNMQNYADTNRVRKRRRKKR